MPNRDRTTLESYQIAFLDRIEQLLRSNYFRRNPRLAVLDSGCDKSGAQLAHLASLTTGEVTGINIGANFPTEEALAALPPNATMLNMNGMELAFEEERFDLVVSANVIEHVSDPIRYINECKRVLKRTGIAYIETCPVWSSPRGHHIHPDMIASNIPAETDYRNDGTVIPDWSHLSFDERQMRDALAPKLRSETVDYIANYLYRSQDLNKTGWRTLRRAFENAFPAVRISTWPAHSVNDQLRPTDGADDYDVWGFTAVCRRTPENVTRRRAIRVVRKIGL